MDRDIIEVDGMGVFVTFTRGTMDKKKRNKKIIKMVQNNPKISFKELGSIFGISWQRVQQILARAGVKKERTPLKQMKRVERKCPYSKCKNPPFLVIEKSKTKQKVYCSNQHLILGRREFLAIRENKKCVDCGKNKPIEAFTKRVLKSGTVTAISICKSCMNIRSKLYAKKNKELIKKYYQEYYKRKQKNKR